MVMPGERYCAGCGAKLEEDVPAEGVTEKVPDAQQAPAMPSLPPRTIEQLRAFCTASQMPLDKMRFFIGVNYQQPRAFGIYREAGRFIVYKNKANGSRAVRYDGPDEACAVGQLYDRLLEECHNRGIFPEGKPEGWDEAKRTARRRSAIVMLVAVLLLIAFVWFAVGVEKRAHRHDGYYRFGTADTWYLYGDDWYYYDTDDWVPADFDPGYDDYGDYYIGSDYDNAWGSGDFTESEAWADIESSHTTSRDYDSWDSGDTDWDSDW